MKSHEQGIRSWSQTTTNLKSATEELIKGQEWATRLQSLLNGMVLSENRSAPAAELVVGVLDSFSKALSLLELESTAHEQPPPDHANSPCSIEKRRQISCMKRKIQPPPRRRPHPYTCRTILSTTIADGYTWRKYGQKDIYGAKHPRSYYRCIHKPDRGCQATRQVQKTDDDESIFAITYMEEHSCSTDATKLLNQSRTTCDIRMDSSIIAANDQQATPLSSTLPSLKQECDEEVISSSSSEPQMLMDFSSPFEGSAPVAHSMEAASEQYDVTSWMISRLDMEFDPEMFQLEDMLDLKLLEEEE